MNYFTYHELCYSDTAIRKGIENIPDASQLMNLMDLKQRILEPLREAFGRPIYINSGFRCPKLNAAVGGVATSQHMRGQAADIVCKIDGVVSPRGNKELFDLIQKLGLPFDQLINENPTAGGLPQWVHVSWAPYPRKQVFVKG